MRVLIIGGSGFLGRHVLIELQARGLEVYALEHRQALPPGPGLKVIRGSLLTLNAAMLHSIRPEIVFHCARPVMPGLKRWGRYLAAQLAFVYNRLLLGRLARLPGKPLLVFASGSLMYGNSRDCVTEAHPLNPMSYARQYYRGEVPILSAHERGAYPVMILRFPWLLGKGSWFEWYYHRAIVEQGAVPLFGNGSNIMSLLDIRDAARLMARYALDQGKPGLYNIPGAASMLQSDFSRHVADAFDASMKPWESMFPRGIEPEALEAFTSNIRLGTQYPELIRDDTFLPVRQSLEDIRNGAGFV